MNCIIPLEPLNRVCATLFLYSEAGVLFVLFFPIVIGMVFAFIGGKKAGLVGRKQSDSIWYGYGKGSLCCLLTIVSIGLLITTILSVSSFQSGIEFFAIGFVGTFFYMAIVLVVGLVLFTMPAFLGYGIGRQSYTAHMMELESRRSVEELKKEIERKGATRPHLS